MSMVALVDPALFLPDPYIWTAHVVRLVGEARRGIRPWKQVYPLLDLPVVAEVWPDRRVRHPASWRVVKVLGQAHTKNVWELVVLIREDLRYRAVAVRSSFRRQCASGETQGSHPPYAHRDS